ncbi:MAG: DUF3784 domain-containing protein [Eubacterium sp.]|nr:DUF3784 domain-containing protein [Eubacterium sp.]
MVVTGIILFVVAAGCLLLGILQILQKGPLINNAWIYADEEQRRTMNKTPHYHQSGIVFSMIGLQFLMLGFFCITKLYFFLAAEFIVIGLVVIFAIVSSVMIERKNKKEHTKTQE